jgi:hypothetical protein
MDILEKYQNENQTTNNKQQTTNNKREWISILPLSTIFLLDFGMRIVDI